MAPITHAVIGEHSCVLPLINTLVTAGYLCGTEWTCDVCAEVHTMTTTNGTAPIWVAASAPKPEQELPEPEEPSLEEFVGEIPGEPVPMLPPELPVDEPDLSDDAPREDIVGELPLVPEIPDEG